MRLVSRKLFQAGLVMMGLLQPLSSFANYSCTFSRWSPGLFGTHYLSSIPKTYQLADGQKDGEFRGVVLASVDDENGRVDYVLNGEMRCNDKNECGLSGRLGALFIADRNSKNPWVRGGSMGDYQISLAGEQEQAFWLQGERALKISCE